MHITHSNIQLQNQHFMMCNYALGSTIFAKIRFLSQRLRYLLALSTCSIAPIAAALLYRAIALFRSLMQRAKALIKVLG